MAAQSLNLDQFTHTFELDFGEDGSQFIHGQIEFNVDEKASYVIQESSIPLAHDVVEHFSNLMGMLQRRFKEFNGIKKIEILQKPLP